MEERLVKICDIKIGKRHRKELGDIERLARSIAEQGLLQAIGITEENQLVFGARRVAAFQLLGREEIPARLIRVKSQLAAEYDENEVRKEFTRSERVAIVEEWCMSRGITHGGCRTANGVQDQNFGLEDAAKRAGFGNVETYRQARKVVLHAHTHLIEAFDKGAISISAAALVAALPKEKQAKIASMNKTQMREALRDLRSDSKEVRVGVASGPDISDASRLNTTFGSGTPPGSWVTQATASADLEGVTWVILCRGARPDVDTLIRLDGDLLGAPNGKDALDTAQTAAFHLAHGGRWQHFRKHADSKSGGTFRNRPEGWPRPWPDPSETVEDEGNVDLESKLGCTNGKGRVNLLANVKVQYLDENYRFVEKAHRQLNGKEVPVNSAEVRTFWQETICKNYPHPISVTLLEPGNEEDRFLCGMRSGQDGPEIRWFKGAR